jgi:hypothetical protein
MTFFAQHPMLLGFCMGVFIGLCILVGAILGLRAALKDL